MGRRADANARHQAKYDAIIARNVRAADRREAQQAQHRGMSGHPANPDKRVSFADMSDKELAAHGRIRTRNFWGTTTISRMETHQDRFFSFTENSRQKREDRKQKVKDKGKKIVKNAVKGKPSGKKTGLLYWGDKRLL